MSKEQHAEAALNFSIDQAILKLLLRCQEVEALAAARSEMQDHALPGQSVLTLATGRTLARTWVASSKGWS